MNAKQRIAAVVALQMPDRVPVGPLLTTMQPPIPASPTPKS